MVWKEVREACVIPDHLSFFSHSPSPKVNGMQWVSICLFLLIFIILARFYLSHLCFVSYFVFLSVLIEAPLLLSSSIQTSDLLSSLYNTLSSLIFSHPLLYQSPSFFLFPPAIISHHSVQLIDKTGSGGVLSACKRSSAVRERSCVRPCVPCMRVRV